MSSGKVAVMALAMVGRMAHYVMESGEVRPMMLVNMTGDEDPANGIVFLDIANDPPADAHDGSGVKVPFMSVSSVPYDPRKSPGTFHWPSVAQHVEADGANVLEHVHDALAKFRTEFLGHVNEKLDAHVEAVGKIADGISAEFQEHVRKLGSDVAAEAGKLVDARFKPPASVERVDEFASGSGGAGAPSAADLDATAAEQQAANATANAAVDAAEAVQQPGAEVGSGG